VNPADKTPRRRHVALIAVAAVIFILAVNSAATQFAADRLSYHPALGAPWAGKVYAPWAWIGWRAQFYDQARATFDLVAAGFGAAGVLASLALMFTVGLQGRSARRHEGVHGTAHWASRAEIEAACCRAAVDREPVFMLGAGPMHGASFIISGMTARSTSRPSPPHAPARASDW
jgi:type IV secretion system protein VirD4